MTTLAACARVRRGYAGARIAAPGMAGAVVALALWQVAAWSLAGSYMLAGPGEVAAWIWANGGLLWRALQVTLPMRRWGSFWAIWRRWGWR
jgi:hypothetical protein